MGFVWKLNVAKIKGENLTKAFIHQEWRSLKNIFRSLLSQLNSLKTPLDVPNLLNNPITLIKIDIIAF